MIQSQQHLHKGRAQGKVWRVGGGGGGVGEKKQKVWKKPKIAELFLTLIIFNSTGTDDI